MSDDAEETIGNSTGDEKELEMGSNTKKNNAPVKEEAAAAAAAAPSPPPPPSPCRSSSSGEIKDDDSDDEIGGNFYANQQPEMATNGQNKPESSFRSSRAYEEPRRFDPENDYRRPHLSLEQINLRVRKIPAPDVLAELSDVELRHLLCDVFDLDREQIRLANNRRRLLEQMRQMHKQELGALRDCMEMLRRLMNERGMNLLATHIGQDVMEFLHEKGQTIGLSGNVQLASANVPASSSESCPGSFGVFPTTQSFIRNPLPLGALFHPEHPSSHGIPPAGASPAVPGSIAVPPPDFSVPPPFTRAPMHAGNDQAYENPGTSTMNVKDASASSSLSAPSLSAIDFGSQNSFRNMLPPGMSEGAAETAGGGAGNSHISRNGTASLEKAGMFSFPAQLDPELEHPGMPPGIVPPSSAFLSMMRAQHFGMLPFHDDAPFMDNGRDPSGFLDERGLPFSNSRIVSLYDDGRLPFHQYEHPQGDEAIRIRHVWNRRPLNNQRRMPLPLMFRDRKIQRIGSSWGAGRIHPGEIRDRSRSPLDSVKRVATNCNETGAAANTMSSNTTGGKNTMISHDENSEPAGIKKIDQS